MYDPVQRRCILFITYTINSQIKLFISILTLYCTFKNDTYTDTTRDCGAVTLTETARDRGAVQRNRFPCWGKKRKKNVTSFQNRINPHLTVFSAFSFVRFIFKTATLVLCFIFSAFSFFSFSFHRRLGSACPEDQQSKQSK